MSEQLQRLENLADERNRIIDFQGHELKIPSVGVYDGQVRYYMANLEWAVLIEGWLMELVSKAAWEESEALNHPGVVGILTFIQGIEAMTLSEDICTGITCAMDKIAAKYLSGTGKDFSVDEDGNIIPDSGGQELEEPPVDDPTTSFDERKAFKAGVYLGVAYGLNQYLSLLNTLYGPAPTPVTSLSDALKIIKNTYVPEAPLDQAVTDYYAWRAVPNGNLPLFNATELAGYLYCNAQDVVLYAVRNYINLKMGVSNELKILYSDLVSGMEETQYNIWQNEGGETPSTQYLEFDCEPIPDYEFTLQWNLTLNDTHTLKKNHRYLITAEGYLSDPDGDLQDAWWHVSAAGVQTFDSVDWNIQVGGAIRIKPSVFEVPYNGAHKYQWTLDMGSINASPQWTINRDAIMAVGSTSPTGGLLVKVHDLGQIIS